MGGKGGGGAADPASYGYVLDPNYTTPDGVAVPGGALVPQAQYDAKYPKQAAAAPAQQAAAPAADQAPAPVADAPAAPAADNSPARNDTLTPSIGGGGDVIADPAAPSGAGSGTVLGGAVKNPPKYWTGNISNFKSGSASKGSGSMQTTQT
jgi:hypothetical protein